MGDVEATMLSALDLPARTHVVGKCLERLQAQLRGVHIGLRFRFEPLRPVADRGVREAYPAVEPRAAAKPADHRHRDRLDYGRAGDRAGMPEIEHGSPCFLQAPGFAHQLLDVAV